MVISVRVSSAEGGTEEVQALIDSGAEQSCVKQSLAIRHNWESKDAQFQLATVEGKEVVTYGISNIGLVVTDSEGTTKPHRHDFVACDFDIPDVSLILGFPWLQQIDPVIRFSTGSWRYPLEVSQIRVLSVKSFRKASKGQVIYCLVLRRVEEGPVLLPLEHTSYADMFNNAAAGILPKHHSMKHRINLEPRAVPL